MITVIHMKLMRILVALRLQPVISSSIVAAVLGQIGSHKTLFSGSHPTSYLLPPTSALFGRKRRLFQQVLLENILSLSLSVPRCVPDLYLFLSLCVILCLSVCLSVCMSVFLFVCLSVCLSFCMSGRLFVCVSICLSVCLFDCLTVFLSVCQSVCLSVSRLCPDVWLAYRD